MLNKENLSMDTLLTVKQAAMLTNVSVPTFYTEQRKHDFGHDPDSKDVWLIPVHLLIRHGFLTEDFEPTRSKRTYSNSSKEIFDGEQNAEIDALRRVIGELETKIRVLEVLVEEKDKQIEMVNLIITRLGKTES